MRRDMVLALHLLEQPVPMEAKLQLLIRDLVSSKRPAIFRAVVYLGHILLKGEEEFLHDDLWIRSNKFSILADRYLCKQDVSKLSRV